MPDINFNCPHCGQNIDAPDDMAGVEIACPVCAEPMVVPGGEPSAEASEGRSIPVGDEASETEKKGTTMRMEVPRNLMPPEPRRRIIKIKRSGK